MVQRAAVPPYAIVSQHCLAGCLTGAASTNRLIHRQSYVLSNNGRTKFADWVAYVVVPAGFGPSRNRTWKADPALPAAETLEPDDYVGANAGLETDRGHQAPLASFAGAEDWRKTNYLSNITPQKSALNQGPWVRLETAVRALARQSEPRGVYVATGPLYERKMPQLPGADEAHLVPSGYWKLVAVKTPARIEVAAFLMDQDLGRSVAFCRDDIRIDLLDLERRAGLRFFPMLDGGTLEAVLGTARSMVARLGCGP